MDQFQLIKVFYEEARTAIEQSPGDRWALDVGLLTSSFKMTPIEGAMWECIREARAVMYPQFPVDKYFLDFASVAAHVAIECDGAEFHQDKERDQARDARLRALGWTVYRVPGHLCLQEADEERESFGMRFVKAVGERHGIVRGQRSPGFVTEEMEECMRYAADGELWLLGRDL